MNKQILFLNQSSGYLMVDIVNAFQPAFNERILVAGNLIERNNSLDEDVVLKKIKAYDRSSTFRRLFTWFLGFFQGLFLVWFKYPHAHLFIVSNPPFATLIPIFCHNSYSLLIYDIYPDALLEYRIFKSKSIIIRFWQSLNHRIFRKACNIFTISDSMKGRLQLYAGENTIQVVPIWADTSFLEPIEKINNPFIFENGLTGKFVVMYSGNMGRTHEVEVLVDVAERLQDENVVFLFIGGGEKQPLIKERIAKLGLNNCLMLPWQPIEKMRFTLSAADIGVVSLGKEAATLSIPSKTFTLLSSGIPLLCLASSDSELARLVNQYNVGNCYSSDNVNLICEFIKALMTDSLLQNELAQNALKASKDFSPGNVKLFLKPFLK